MKISGTAVLNAPVDQVWAAFNDPAVLARTIPGCQELREVGPDAYKMTGGTDLSYDADAVVGGVIGGVGQRMLTGVAKKMAGQFFAAVDADIAGLRAPGAMPETALVPAGAPGTQITYAGSAAGGRTASQGNGFRARDFLYGTLVGAAIALAGVAVGIAAGRR